MPRYAAFLRGINVTGRRVKSDELKARFEDLGFPRVDVFRASGNVILDAERASPSRLTARIEEGLRAALGYEVATFLRTADQVREIAAHQPFDRAQVESSGGRLQVAMLSKKPARRARESILGLATDQDLLALKDRELYWLPSGGTQDSSLDQKAIVRALGLMTFRTKNTVEEISRRYFAD